MPDCARFWPSVLGAVFVAALLPVQWFFSRSFSCSPRSDNWFFAGDRYWGYQTGNGPWRHKFWHVDPAFPDADPITLRSLGLGLGIGRSQLLDRIGVGELDAKGPAMTRRGLAWLLATFWFPGVALAHIGSPDVFSEGMAGPYPARVTIRMPSVVPGRAEIIVRVLTNSSGHGFVPCPFLRGRR